MKRVLICAALIIFASTSNLWAKTYDLVIAEKRLSLSGKKRTALTINGGVPGPTLVWREGETVTLRVTNRLSVDTSIHWHGLILPTSMDGVPSLSFKGIKPGTTFVYRFKVQQNGTYWYHSHSGLQEQSGVYGSIVIKPKGRDRVRYDREHVIVLSDWTDEDPHSVLANLKKRSDYYNRNKPTLVGLIKKLRRARTAKERATIWRERLAWAEMRMDSSDIADVSGMTYTYLLNGKRAKLNWTGLFKPGERVRLRFINAGAMTYFDVKIPGLKMTVVQADGQDVVPVRVDEFRIAVAETYDVIVTPRQAKAYTIFARSMDRSGYARGTLAPRRGMAGPIPSLGKPTMLRMSEMGPVGHGGHGSHGSHRAAMKKSADPHTGHKMAKTADPHAGHQMKKSADPHAGHNMGKPADPHAGHKMASRPAYRRHAVGSYSQLTKNAGRSPDGSYKKLTYGDLKNVSRLKDLRKPGRTIVLRLTGNMEAYFWTINGKKYSDAKPIRLKYGERVRIRFENETMMAHPMHLHGMWSELRNGNGQYNPRKHTISVGPGQVIEMDVTADAIGQWAFHCHLLLHMETGMFRKVIVADVASN